MEGLDHSPDKYVTEAAPGRTDWVSCGGADAGTGPILLCFDEDIFHLGIWETACPFSALMMLWSLGKRDRIMASTRCVTWDVGG